MIKNDYFLRLFINGLVVLNLKIIHFLDLSFFCYFITQYNNVRTPYAYHIYSKKRIIYVFVSAYSLTERWCVIGPFKSLHTNNI